MLFQYLFLLVLNGIFLYVLNKYDTFFRAPLYAIYFFSFFFFNILGSCVVFFPELSIYGYHYYYTPDFFYILVIQSISFWLFLPVHLFKTQKLNFHVDNTNLKRILNVTRIFFYVSFLIVGIFILNYGLPPFFKTDLTVGNTLLVQERTDFFSSVSNFWFYEIGFFILPQFITVFLFVNSRINKSIKNQILFYCLLAYSSLLSLSFLHKNPLLFLFFNLFFVQILFFTKKISYFLIIRFSLVFIALILLGYSIALSGNDIESYGIVIWGIANRIFGVYPLQLSVTLKIVEEVGYLFGTAIPNFFGLFPYEVFFLSKSVHFYIFKFDGYAPPPAIGFAYANFGYLGIIVHLFVVNSCLFFYNRLVKIFKNKIFVIALFSYFSIQVMFLPMTTIFNNLLNPADLIVILSIIFLYMIKWKKIRSLSS